MNFSFLINLFAVLLNLGALVYNGGSNPTWMAINSLCALISGYFAFQSFKRV